MDAQYINLHEKLEKHAELNPKIFTDDQLIKDEVRTKLLEIADAFLDDLEKDGIKIIIKDILLIGSNASYNYTKDSDLDLHILADTASLHCPDNLYPMLYSAYRSIFNKKYDISVYNIPVEVYVETEDITTKSNGIYSIKNNEWVKKPELMDIPEINEKALATQTNTWTDRIQKLITKAHNVTTTNANKMYTNLIDILNALYDLRRQAIKIDGEYGLGNLVFKEIRNAGLLDELKDVKNEVMSKKLTLESLKENLALRQLEEYRMKIGRLTREQPIVQRNGYFFIHNIKENNIDRIVNILQKQNFIEYVRRGAAGRYDFSHIQPFKQPQRYYTIEGKIKDIKEK